MKTYSRILYVGPHINYPPIGGPELRTWNSLLAFARIPEVDVYVLGTRRLSPSTVQQLESVGVEVVSHLKSKWLMWGKSNSQPLVNEIKFAIRKFEIAVLWWSYAPLYSAEIGALRNTIAGLTIVADTDSVWSRFIERGVVAARDEKHAEAIRREAQVVRRAEAELKVYSDIVTAVSEVDAEYYEGLTGNAITEVFANVVDASTYSGSSANQDSGECRIIVSGSYYDDHSPMVHGTRWLIESVFPLVWRSMPQARLEVVGRGSDAHILSHDERVRVYGEVESITAHLERATLSVVPLFFESGTRFKILEAGISRVPVVSTTLGAEGLLLTPDEAIVIADDPEEFANAIVSLCSSPVRRSTVAANALREIKGMYGIERAVIDATRILGKCGYYGSP